MKKIITFLGLTFLLFSVTFALEVNQSELKSTENQTIEFINYTGPHKVIDSLAAIKAIGTNLGVEIAKNVEEPAETGNKAKYYVVHAVDPNEGGKLDADILYLGSDAQVDHIVNLRRIIGAYLVAAYGYSEKDAETIAVFVTVYNAVYRGKIDDFNSKYKKIVNDNLTSEKCGLDVNWQNWAGKSEIVIPLFDVSGGLSTVDTSVISDSNVIESMKEDDDKNIDARKDMVDIKEREAENASEQAKESQKKATEEQKKLNEEKEKTAEAQQKADEDKQKAEEAQKQADEAQAQADEAQKKADENPDDEEAQKEAAEAQKQADEAQAQADEAKSNADKSQEELEEQKEAEKAQAEKTQEARDDAKEAQERADKKNTEAQNERKEIAKDQSEVQKTEAAQAKMTTDFGLVLVDEVKMTSRLVKFNTADGKSIKDSPVASIRNRTIYKCADGYIAIAGENVGNGTIKLVIINGETMEITKESDETVSEKSMLVQDGSSYYCVVQSDDSWVLAKYDSSLKIQLKSSEAVKESTPITVTSAGIAVTDASGKIKVLSKDNLNPLK